MIPSIAIALSATEDKVENSILWMREGYVVTLPLLSWDKRGVALSSKYTQPQEFKRFKKKLPKSPHEPHWCGALGSFDGQYVSIFIGRYYYIPSEGRFYAFCKPEDPSTWKRRTKYITLGQIENSFGKWPWKKL